MKIIIIALYTFIYFIYFISILGCKKESNTIGLGVHPPEDKINVNFSDTTTLSVFTVCDDSVSSSNLSLNLLGSYIDPIFGDSKAEFLTHIRLSSINFDFGDNPDPDSIVLYLAYQNYYGNASIEQEIKVYKLTQDIDKDSVYYSNLNINSYYNSSDELAYINYYPDDSIIAITLSNTLAEELLDDVNSDIFTDDDKFVDFFKGLYIKTGQVPIDAAVVYYNLLSSESKMTLYYNDTLSYDFVIDNECARINLFYHNYSSTNIDTTGTKDDSVVYVQSMGGVKAKIKFPYINNWSDSGAISINKAELVIKVEDNTTNDYAPPTKLLLTEIINQEGEIDLLDDQYVGEDYFDGSYDSESNTYKFNIARHIQQLIDGKEDFGLYLFPADNRVSANRAILTSGKHSNKMKLLITYSKL